MKTRQQKRDEAASRQAVYDALTPTEQLARTNTRRGDSTRERVRIMARLGE
jgi:hypothetical protein